MYPQKSKEEQQSGLISEDSKECGITEEEYQFLIDDIAQAIEDGNRMYGYGEPGYIDNDGNYHPFIEDIRYRKYRANRKLRFRVKPVFAVAVSKSKVQEEKEEEVACLEFLRSKMRAADPVLKESFRNKIEGVEF
jgi:hypothetical protein